MSYIPGKLTPFQRRVLAILADDEVMMSAMEVTATPPDDERPGGWLLGNVIRCLSALQEAGLVWLVPDRSRPVPLYRITPVGLKALCAAEERPDGRGRRKP